jgi:Protein of unknown function (DUF3990)
MARRSPSAILPPLIPARTHQPIELYHGTAALFVPSILSGVDVKAGNRFTDFGLGFYATTLLRQARFWARRVAFRYNSLPAVVHFTVDRTALARLDTLWFVRGGRDAVDYWSLVRHCRLGGDQRRAGRKKWYDVVVGPVARRWLVEVEADPDYDQASFHSSRVARLLDASNPRVVQ